MSQTPSERQTGIEKDRGEQAASAEANSRPPGSRSLRAGGEFLKALAGDLAAVLSRLRRSLIAMRHRRTPPPRAPAPSRVSPGPGAGRVLWRVSIVLLGFGSICAGALCAVMLWVLFGFPSEPRRSDAATPGLQLEAAKGEPVGPTGPPIATAVLPPDFGRAPAAQVRPEDCAYQPFDPRHLCQSGTSSADAAKQEKAKETQTEPGAGSDQPQLARTETQDRPPAARQQEISTTLTAAPAGMRCNLDRCAATYKSFNAADCTYEPYGGGPRRMCELSRSIDARPQTPRAATDPSSETPEARIAEKAEEVGKTATPARAGAQCNVDLCAATYASFKAADCTYQPHGGGPRRICER